MKKKQRQFLAMLLVLAMLVTTVGGTGVGETFVRAAELEETKEESNKNAEILLEDADGGYFIIKVARTFGKKRK